MDRGNVFYPIKRGSEDSKFMHTFLKVAKAVLRWHFYPDMHQDLVNCFVIYKINNMLNVIAVF